MANARLDPPHWHSLDGRAVSDAVVVKPESGLATAEVSRRLTERGPNALPEPATRSLLAVFATQFKSPLIYLLLLAAGIAFSLSHVTDGVVIAVVVVLNAVIGAFQEGRAERSLAALRRLASHPARVIRDGQGLVIEARDVVYGDILLMEAGDAVAADARLLEGASLQVAEAALTGESLPVNKDPAVVPADTSLADRTNMLFAGTYIAAGRARAVVVATGIDTEIGHIASLASGAVEQKTPLERRIAEFGRYVMIASAILFVIVIGVGRLRGLPFADVVMIAISQVVGMIPEGLPVSMTIALAVGVQRMARRNAVVRRLSAVETLGSTTVICSDKTGTLTRNEMTVTSILVVDGREITVTGAGYEPKGEFLLGDQPLDPLADPPLRALLEAIILCNDGLLKSPTETETRFQPVGDPTEVALLTAAIKGGLIPDVVRKELPRRAEIPFDATVQMMATEHASRSGNRVVIKGAPEVVLDLCAADAAVDAARAAADAMASRALRVLAVAIVDDGQVEGARGFAVFRGRARLLGLIGQIDPPRPEVKVAVAQCRAAGIRPVMVTGDHKRTGLAIARALGMADDDEAGIDGRELERLSDAELAARIHGISVFARVHPAQKLRIIDAYQRSGETVAMTGDGVNDAPALVKADVGVAMGITGTEVAKESAKIVIADDNFATIVAAVEEGRIVYRNIKKAVLLLFSTSASEVLILLLAMLLGYPPPFAAVQILWNNLVTEGLITVNLIMEPAEGDEMAAKPIPRDEPLLSRTLLLRMAVMVPAITIVTLGWFIWRTRAGVAPGQVQTETFTLLAICEWFNVLNCRSERASGLGLGLWKNPWLVGGLVVGNLLQVAVVFWSPLGRIFHTSPIGWREVLLLGALGSVVLWVEEARKALARFGAARRAMQPRPA